MKLFIICGFLLLLSKQSSAQQLAIKEVSSNDIADVIKKNDYTVIYFWGTWCYPCVKHLHAVMDLKIRFPNINFIFLADPNSKAPLIRKDLRNVTYPDSFCYQLDRKIYTLKASGNIKQFTREICLNCAAESGDYIFSGLYLFGKDLRLYYYNKKAIDESELIDLREILTGL